MPFKETNPSQYRRFTHTKTEKHGQHVCYFIKSCHVINTTTLQYYRTGLSSLPYNCVFPKTIASTASRRTACNVQVNEFPAKSSCIPWYTHKVSSILEKLVYFFYFLKSNGNVSELITIYSPLTLENQNRLFFFLQSIKKHLTSFYSAKATSKTSLLENWELTGGIQILVIKKRPLGSNIR